MCELADLSPSRRNIVETFEGGCPEMCGDIARNKMIDRSLN
jgi:hypothetical protein